MSGCDKDKEQLLKLREKLSEIVKETSAKVEECKVKYAEAAKQRDYALLTVERLRSAAGGSSGLLLTLNNQLKLESGALNRLEEQEFSLTAEKTQLEMDVEELQHKIDAETSLLQEIEDDLEAEQERVNELQERLESTRKMNERIEMLDDQLAKERQKRRALDDEEHSILLQMHVVEDLLASLQQCRDDLQHHFDKMHASFQERELVLRGVLEGGRKKVDAFIEENETMRTFLQESSDHMKQLEESISRHEAEFQRVNGELDKTKTTIASLQKEIDDAKKEVESVKSATEAASAAEKTETEQKLLRLKEMETDQVHEHGKTRQEIEDTIQQLHQRAFSTSSSSSSLIHDPAYAREIKALRIKKETVKQQEQEMKSLQDHIAELEGRIKVEQDFIDQKPKSLIDAVSIELSFGKTASQNTGRKIPFTMIIASLIVFSLVAWIVYLRVLVHIKKAEIDS